jgi:hypothetical protein
MTTDTTTLTRAIVRHRAAGPLQERQLMPLDANDDIAALSFFDTYGDRADAVLRAILRIRSATRRARRKIEAA